MHRESYHSSNHFSLYLDNYKVISRNTPFTLQSNQQRMGVHTYLTGKHKHDCWKDFAWGILCVFFHAVVSRKSRVCLNTALLLNLGATYFLPGWSRKTLSHIKMHGFKFGGHIQHLNASHFTFTSTLFKCTLKAEGGSCHEGTLQENILHGQDQNPWKSGTGKKQGTTLSAHWPWTIW